MIGAIRLPRLFQRPLLDVKFGFALMRDRRVALRHKVWAMVLGLGITGIVEVCEIPVETIVAAVLPFLGAFGDVVMDGAELVAGPVILAALLLPLIAPHEVVTLIHAERTGKAAPKDSQADSVNSAKAAKAKVVDI